jgi:hypothetical protein
MTFSKNRIWLVLGIIAYVAAFQWMYATWLSPTFAYWGFAYEQVPGQYLTIAWALSVLPALWLPLALTRPSQLICWVLYLAVFIPSMFVPLFAGLRDAEEVANLMFTLFAGFALVSTVYWWPVLKLPNFRIPPVLFWSCFSGAAACLIAWVATVYIGHFRFVTFGEIYQQLRFSGQELAMGTGVNYAVMWLSGAFAPILMSWALVANRYRWFFVGTAVQVILYSTAGLKSILLSVIVMPILFLLVRGGAMPVKLTWLAVLGFVALNVSNLVAGELSESHLMLSSIVFMRTFGVAGLSTAQYHDFFSEHPMTYYSHVKGIDLFVDYPYVQALGREVGYFYSGKLDLNFNAHLWCMDGLAGFGLPGILLISTLCAVVFWLLDSAADGHPITFSATAMNFAALNLSNASLFTTLFSGGLMFSILMFYFMPKTLVEEAREPDFLNGSDQAKLDEGKERQLFSNENDPGLGRVSDPIGALAITDGGESNHQTTYAD